MVSDDVYLFWSPGNRRHDSFRYRELMPIATGVLPLTACNTCSTSRRGTSL